MIRWSVEKISFWLWPGLQVKLLYCIKIIKINLICKILITRIINWQDRACLFCVGILAIVTKISYSIFFVVFESNTSETTLLYGCSCQVVLLDTAPWIKDNRNIWKSVTTQIQTDKHNIELKWFFSCSCFFWSRLVDVSIYISLWFWDMINYQSLNNWIN